MAGIQDLMRRFDAGGSITPQNVSTQNAPAQPFSTDPTINAAWQALAGKTGADVAAQRTALAQQQADYQTSQNLASMYGLTDPTAQKQFLTDFNTAAATPGFQYLDPTGNAYAPTASQTFEQALTAANAAAPGKGASNALMSQFTTGQGASDNPFLGQYNYETSGGTTNITPMNAQQLSNKLNPTPATPYTPPLQTGETAAIGSVFDNTKYSNIQSTGLGSDGYIHVVTTTGEYLLNPNSKRVVSFTPSNTAKGTGNFSSGASGSGMAGMASGGAIGMPQDYSQGNWKLI